MSDNNSGSSTPNRDSSSPIKQALPQAQDGERVGTTAAAQADISLRDYFATHLVVDDLSMDMARELMDQQPSLVAHSLEFMRWWAEAEARYRYLCADAMLKARGSR